MSNILDNTILRPHEITKSKHKEPKTSSILIISLAITMAIILLMYAGIWNSESIVKQYFACRDKIIGFEQRGFYESPEQFRLSLSFCDTK
ncbi:MAG TPA: hypothetical protein VF220_10360 [Nitrososphaeraceae archaeon]